jgi:ribose 5-phosphate isomerase B
MSGECDRGILVCGTGIGMAIAANKFPGIRAAQVYDPYSAERSRKSNDAQIMTMGALTMGMETAKYLVGIWLKCDFVGGRSARKVDKINAIDQQFRNKPTFLCVMKIIAMKNKWIGTG